MNYYAKAIEVLSDKNCDYRKICFEIAKRHPKTLVVCATNWIPAAKALLKTENGLVKAIKLCRQETGWDLKTAKDECEKLRK